MVRDPSQPCVRWPTHGLILAPGSLVQGHLEWMFDVPGTGIRTPRRWTDQKMFHMTRSAAHG